MFSLQEAERKPDMPYNSLEGGHSKVGAGLSGDEEIGYKESD